MRLEIDSGNTLLKWRLVDSGGSIATRGIVNQESDLSHLLDIGKSVGPIDHVLISSVSGAQLVDAVLHTLVPGLKPERIFVARSLPVMAGVVFSYEDPDRLGIDRCLAMISASRQFSDGVMVIDCGSAITADIVSDQGVHLGGLILPGIRLLRASLMKGTSNVNAGSSAPDQLLLTSTANPGCSTEACVDNGLHIMIHSTLLALKKLAFNNGVRNLVLTGGDGGLINSTFELGLPYQKDLVLDGLSILNPFQQLGNIRS